MGMLYRVGGRRKFSSWPELSAWLTSAGSSYDGEAALVNKTTGLTIGRWAYVGSAITPIGPVRFDRVSASKYALVTSRDSDTQATLTAGHTLPASGTAYVWDTSGAAALHTALAFTVSGNTLTTTGTLAAALTGGDQIWIADTELCVGTGCAVQPGAGGACYFATGIVWPAQTSISTYSALSSDTTAIVVEHGGATIADSANAHAMWGRSIAGDIGRWGYLRTAAGAWRVAIQTAALTFNAGTAATTPGDERRLDAAGLNFFIAESSPGGQAHAANPAWATARQTTALSQDLLAAAVTITSVRVM